MKSFFNTDRRLILPFALIILVFLICIYLVVNSYHTAPDDFEKLKTAQARLDEIQKSTTGRNQAARSRIEGLNAALASVMEELDKVASGMEKIQATHSQMADNAVTTRQKPKRPSLI